MYSSSNYQFDSFVNDMEPRNHSNQPPPPLNFSQSQQFYQPPASDQYITPPFSSLPPTDSYNAQNSSLRPPSGPPSLEGNSSANPFRSTRGRQRFYQPANTFNPAAGFTSATLVPVPLAAIPSSNHSHLPNQINISANDQSKIDPLGFSQYTNNEISNEKIKKAELENEKLRVEKEANRNSQLQKLQEKKDRILAEQKNTWAKQLNQQNQDKENAKIEESFNNFQEPTNTTPKTLTLTKEERRKLRKKADKVRQLKAKRPQNFEQLGSLEGLINEVSSRGGSICSDLSDLNNIDSSSTGAASLSFAVSPNNTQTNYFQENSQSSRSTNPNEYFNQTSHGLSSSFGNNSMKTPIDNTSTASLFEDQTHSCNTSNINQTNASNQLDSFDVSSRHGLQNKQSFHPNMHEVPAAAGLFKNTQPQQSSNCPSDFFNPVPQQPSSTSLNFIPQNQEMEKSSVSFFTDQSQLPQSGSFNQDAVSYSENTSMQNLDLSNNPQYSVPMQQTINGSIDRYSEKISSHLSNQPTLPQAPAFVQQTVNNTYDQYPEEIYNGKVSPRNEELYAPSNFGHQPHQQKSIVNHQNQSLVQTSDGVSAIQNTETRTIDKSENSSEGFFNQSEMKYPNTSSYSQEVRETHLESLVPQFIPQHDIGAIASASEFSLTSDKGANFIDYSSQQNNSGDVNQHSPEQYHVQPATDHPTFMQQLDIDVIDHAREVSDDAIPQNISYDKPSFPSQSNNCDDHKNGNYIQPTENHFEVPNNNYNENRASSEESQGTTSSASMSSYGMISSTHTSGKISPYQFIDNHENFQGQSTLNSAETSPLELTHNISTATSSTFEKVNPPSSSSMNMSSYGMSSNGLQPDISSINMNSQILSNQQTYDISSNQLQPNVSNPQILSKQQPHKEDTSMQLINQANALKEKGNMLFQQALRGKPIKDQIHQSQSQHPENIPQMPIASDQKSYEVHLSENKSSQEEGHLSPHEPSSTQNQNTNQNTEANQYTPSNQSHGEITKQEQVHQNMSERLAPSTNSIPPEVLHQNEQKGPIPENISANHCNPVNVPNNQIEINSCVNEGLAAVSSHSNLVLKQPSNTQLAPTYQPPNTYNNQHQLQQQQRLIKNFYPVAPNIQNEMESPANESLVQLNSNSSMAFQQQAAQSQSTFQPNSTQSYQQRPNPIASNNQNEMNSHKTATLMAANSSSDLVFHDQQQLNRDLPNNLNHNMSDQNEASSVTTSNPNVVPQQPDVQSTSVLQPPQFQNYQQQPNSNFNPIVPNNQNEMRDFSSQMLAPETSNANLTPHQPDVQSASVYAPPFNQSYQQQPTNNVNPIALNNQNQVRAHSNQTLVPSSSNTNIVLSTPVYQPPNIQNNQQQPNTNFNPTVQTNQNYTRALSNESLASVSSNSNLVLRQPIAQSTSVYQPNTQNYQQQPNRDFNSLSPNNQVEIKPHSNEILVPNSNSNITLRHPNAQSGAAYQPFNTQNSSIYHQANSQYNNISQTGTTERLQQSNTVLQEQKATINAADYANPSNPTVPNKPFQQPNIQSSSVFQSSNIENKPQYQPSSSLHDRPIQESTIGSSNVYPNTVMQSDNVLQEQRVTNRISDITKLGQATAINSPNCHQEALSPFYQRSTSQNENHFQKGLDFNNSNENKANKDLLHTVSNPVSSQPTEPPRKFQSLFTGVASNTTQPKKESPLQNQSLNNSSTSNTVYNSQQLSAQTPNVASSLENVNTSNVEVSRHNDNQIMSSSLNSGVSGYSTLPQPQPEIARHPVSVATANGVSDNEIHANSPSQATLQQRPSFQQSDGLENSYFKPINNSNESLNPAASQYQNNQPQEHAYPTASTQNSMYPNTIQNDPQVFDQNAVSQDMSSHNQVQPPVSYKQNVSSAPQSQDTHPYPPTQPGVTYDQMYMQQQGVYGNPYMQGHYGMGPYPQQAYDYATWQYQQQQWLQYQQYYGSSYADYYQQYGWNQWPNPYDTYSYHSSAASSSYGGSRPGSVIERHSAADTDDAVLNELADLTDDILFTERAVSPPPEEVVQRTTPLSFTRPHIVASFNKTGGLLSIVEPKQPLDGEIALVQNVPIEDIISIPLFKRFPGPLIRGDTSRKQMLNFINDTVYNILPEHFNGNEYFDQRILWEFVALLVRQNGTYDGSDVSEMLLSLLPTELDMEGNETKNLISLTKPTVAIPLHAQEEFQLYVACGRLKDAFEHCLRQKDWGHAFMLAHSMGPKFVAVTKSRFSQSLKESNPVKMLYGHLMNKDMNYIKRRVTKEHWIQNLCVLISHSCGDKERDKEKIIAFGDSLRDFGIIGGAHLCYLISNVTFGKHSDAGNRLTLLGLEHKNYTDKRIGLICQELNVQLTEIYQFAKRLHQASFTIPAFQPYLLEYSLKIYEYGYGAQVLAYFETISNAVNNDQTQTLYEHEFCYRLSKISHQLLLQDVERYEDKENPHWLEALDRYTNIAVDKTETNTNYISSSADTQQQSSSENVAESTNNLEELLHTNESQQEYSADTPVANQKEQYNDLNADYDCSYYPENEAPLDQVDKVDNQYVGEVENESMIGQEQYQNKYQPFEGQPYESQSYESEQGFNQNAPPPFLETYETDNSDQMLHQPSFYNPMENGYDQRSTDYSNEELINDDTNTTTSDFSSSVSLPNTYRENEPLSPATVVADNAEEEDLKEEDLFGGFSKQKNKPNVYAKSKDENKKKEKFAEKIPPSTPKQGWISGIFSRFSVNKEIHLPEDNEQKIVFDETLGKWVDKDADESEQSGPPPPPPKGSFGTPKSVSSSESPLMPSSTSQSSNNLPPRSYNNIPSKSKPKSNLKDNKKTLLDQSNEIDNTRKSSANQEDTDNQDNPLAPPSRFSLKAHGGGRRANRYVNIMGNSTKSSAPMSPVLDPFSNLNTFPTTAPIENDIPSTETNSVDDASQSAGEAGPLQMPIFFNPTQMNATPSSNKSLSSSNRSRLRR